MTRLISYDIYDEIFDLLSNTQNKIRIISPFIGLKTSSELSEIIHTNQVQVDLITRFSRSDFYDQASSIEGLLLLKEAGASIKAVKDLHTKLYIFDNQSIIIGSSNFTRGGLMTNLELNVLFDDDQEIIGRAVDYFNEMDLTIPNEYSISLDKIRNEQIILNSIDSKKKRQFDSRSDFGYSFTPKVRSDVIEQAFDSVSELNKSDTTAWIKFEGFSDIRRTKGEEVIQVNIENGLYKTNFPKRPKGFKTGDIVFVGRNSFDKIGHMTSQIFGYGIVRKWEKSQEEPKEWQEADPDIKRWPYFVYIERFVSIKGKFNECVSIHDLYASVGKNTFPTTRNRNILIDDLSRMHSQKDKLRITDDAKNYLLSEIAKRM